MGVRAEALWASVHPPQCSSVFWELPGSEEARQGEARRGEARQGSPRVKRESTSPSEDALPLNAGGGRVQFLSAVVSF